MPGDIEGCIEKLLAACEKPSPPYIYIEHCEKSFENMFRIIENENEE